MKILLAFTWLTLNSATAQTENPKIELSIIISTNDAKAPVRPISGYIMREDSLRIDFVTDTMGVYEITEQNHPGFLEPEKAYEIRIDGTNKEFLGATNAFRTRNIVQNTRIIRNLKIIPSCTIGQPKGINFIPNSVELDSTSTNELNWFADYFLEQKTIQLEITTIYFETNNSSLAQKRAEQVQLIFIKNGIDPQRISIKLLQKEQKDPAEPDLYFSIISFDFKS